MQKLARLKAEMELMSKNPPPGIYCWLDDENPELIHVEMSGPENSPFSEGTFQLQVLVNEKYPFTPPLIMFITPVYHPNIDPQGRICLTALKPKPSGTWSVTLNIPTVLSAIRILLSEPNLSDPLMTDIAKEYSENYTQYKKKAVELTRQHATKKKFKPDPCSEATVFVCFVLTRSRHGDRVS